MWPTTFMTRVHWQLGEMGTESQMSVVVYGIGGMRQVVPQNLLQRHFTGRWHFIAHDLFVLPRPRPKLVVSHLRGVTTNSTEPNN